MKKFTVFAMALILLITMAACGAQPAQPQGGDAPSGGQGAQDPSGPQQGDAVPPRASLQLTLEEWPVVDGATAFLPYYSTMAARMLGLPADEARQYVYCSTTDYAYPKLIEGEVDLIFCLRPSQAQVDDARSRHVRFEQVPFLSEAFVFFVNKENPVDSLTVQQLHDIYAGKITNWKQVGGKDEEIIAYQRSEGSGSQTGLYLHVISEDEVVDPPTEKRIGDMGGIVDAVASYENASGALGYSYLYFVTNQHYDESIKLLKIEGVAPTTDNVASRSYPLISDACAVFRSDEPEDSLCRSIAAWCTSDEGQALAYELGYVGVKK